MAGKKRHQPAAALPAEEESFPRGGGTSLAPIVHKQIQQEAYAEAEEELLGNNRKGKRRKTSATHTDGGGGTDGDDEDAFFASLAAREQLPKFVELLKFRTLSLGTKLWGAVAEIGPRELVVALPHGLKGHVAYKEASDALAERWSEVGAAAESAAVKRRKKPASSGNSNFRGVENDLPALADLFSVGQLVRCSICGLHGGKNADADGDGVGAATQQTPKNNPNKGDKPRNKRVDVTLRVSAVNVGLGPEAIKEGTTFPASVRSVEDHGYILTLGIKGTTAFLPKKQAPTPLHAGSLVDVVIQSAPRPGVPAMTSADPATVAAAVTREWDGLNIGTLLPGSLVTARVRNVLSDGLLVSFLTFFTGTIDPFHLGSASGGASGGSNESESWKRRFSPNQRVKARILYVDPISKRIGLTLLPHLLSNSPSSQLPELGHVYEIAEIRRIDDGLGVLLDLNPGGAATSASLPRQHRGYAHISNLSDDRIDDVRGSFRLGQVVRCRVIGHRPMDALVAVSLKQSVVEGGGALTAKDVDPGLRVKGTVVKADENMMLLQLTPHLKAMVPAQHMSEALSKRAHRKFKIGQTVAGRVLAVDRATKKIAVTLKQTLVDSKLPIIACLEDAMPGGRSHGVVTGVQDYGLFVTFFANVAGLVPIAEAGLSEGQTLADAFAVGQVVKCRVIGVDVKRGRLRLSLVSKKKAAEAAAAAKASDRMGGLEKGAVVMGRVATVHHTTQLDDVNDDEEQQITHFTVDLFLKPDVPAAHTNGRDDESDEAALYAAEPTATGRLDVAHLSDHPAAAAALAEALTVGALLGPLLVLQRLDVAKCLRVTRKASLMAAAASHSLPSELSELSEGSVFPGYVASVVSDGVFVRFLGDLTGRAGLAQLSDTFVSDPSAHFSAGQSVRARVVEVDASKGRCALSLKRSLTAGSSDADHLVSYFVDADLAHTLAAAAESAGSDKQDVGDPERIGGTPETSTCWASDFPLGGVIEGQVDGVKDYGLLIDNAMHPDVIGLAATHHFCQNEGDTTVKFVEGTPVSAVVLDVSSHHGVVDVSLRPELLERAVQAVATADNGSGGEGNPAQQSKKKRRKIEGGGAASAIEEQAAQTSLGGTLEEGQEVRVKVLLTKPEEGYCVVSLPEGYRSPCWLGYMATTGFNLAPTAAAAFQPRHDVELDAIVSMLPSMRTRKRLILRPKGSLLSSGNEANGIIGQQQPSAGGGSKKPWSANLPAPGKVVEGKIEAVHALHADITLESGVRGRMHITEVVDLPSATNPADENLVANPLAKFKAGDSIRAVVLGRMQSSEGRRHGLLELSCRPSKVADFMGASRPLSWGDVRVGHTLRGYVQEVSGEWVWMVFSPYVRGRAFLPQAASSLQECRAPGKRFRPGAAICARVAAVESKKRSLDVYLLDKDTEKPIHTPASQLRVGDMAMGVITATGGSAGVVVGLGDSVAGRVALTDVHDRIVSNALTGLAVGQYVRVAVVAAGAENGGNAVRRPGLALSLRPSRGGECAAHRHSMESVASSLASALPAPPESLSASSLTLGQRIGGYVKSVSKAGAFVCLARGVDARIKLRQLSDEFIDDPGKAYPEGMYVEATVTGVEGGKIDLTCRKRRATPSLAGLQEGQAVRGRVRKVEKFGVFVELEKSGAVGLAHVSELDDGFVRDPGRLFKPDQRVRARVLSVDVKDGRLSLGLKASYFGGEFSAGDEDDEDADSDAASDHGEEEDFDAELAAAMPGDGGGMQTRHQDTSSEDEQNSEEDGGSGSDSKFDEEEGTRDGEEGPEGNRAFDLDEALLAGAGELDDSDE